MTLTTSQAQRLEQPATVPPMTRPTFVLSVLVLATGCRAPRQIPIEVLSDPPGARIICNGEFVGVTPVAIEAELTWDGSLLQWNRTYINLEAIPTREMMVGPGVSGTVQRRNITLDEPRETPFKVFFDMGLSPRPDVEADINVDIN